MTSEQIFFVFLGFVFLVMGIVYVVPSIIAFRRRHPDRLQILIVNLAFGATLIGWVAAIIWALQGIGHETTTDDELSLPTATIAQELEHLHQLLNQGAISQAEYDTLKAQLVGGGA